MVRVFNVLRMRLLMERQVEIAKLQDRLFQCDLEIDAENANELVTLDWEPKSAKRLHQISLLKEIHTKLKDYGQRVGLAARSLADCSQMIWWLEQEPSRPQHLPIRARSKATRLGLTTKNR